MFFPTSKTSMHSIARLYVLSCFLTLFSQISHAGDTLTVAGSIRDGDTITSATGIFELGFFSPGNSTNRYVGIWYKNVSVLTAVWVANRQAPLANRSGVLKLAHNSSATLTLFDGNNPVWSSSSVSNVSRKPILQLFDSGNLVVRDETDDNPESFHWQSFDHPIDTLLPGMKLGVNFKTGVETYLSSWRSNDDPSPGDYTYHCVPTGYPQLIMKKQSNVSFRLGSWNGLGFSGLPRSNFPTRAPYTYRVVINPVEVYFIFDHIDIFTWTKLTVTPDGIAQRLTWIGESQDWRVFYSGPAERCDTYSLCGAYSSCNIICNCLERFVPRSQNEWNQWGVNVGSGGCVRVSRLDCKTDGFRKYSGLKLPDTRSTWFNASMNLDDCKAKCSRNCSCTAYATLDIKQGRGCLLWFGDLIDMRDLPTPIQDIYVRMASSDSDRAILKSSGSSNKKHVILKVVLPLIMGIFLLGLSLLVYIRRKRKRPRPNKKVRLGNINETQKDDMELQLFALPTIVYATKNFSTDNKLGEGGFGPVYKGTLDEGQEIAVKRLSKSSTQGLQEFENEVICIAKLQHRNLVKLLGYCVQDDEMMLVYEYMPNKSLDVFLFDERRRKLLGWPKRFEIIQGIARGLLYLHQDSRLRIIHRDLKASNVLLDYDMNPKISDFGLARRFRGNEMGANTRMVVGTYGYMSPEYAVHGLFSVKSDVFSFGVLLLEIVSGKKNRGFFQQDHGDNLLAHAWRLYQEEKSLEMVDVSLHESWDVSEALRSIQVGLLCVQHSPGDRPSMSSVVLMLGGEGPLPRPKQPGFFSEDNKLETECLSSGGARFCSNEITTTLVAGR